MAIPAEPRDVSSHGTDDALRAELQDEAKRWGVFGPQLSEELGGLGLDHRGTAVILEECGYSLLGPQALNCAAPDEGNMHMLDLIASPEQREHYLVPLAAGQIRSCFSMTEPAPGAGSDPSMLLTTARKIDGGWSISGRKWFITGAEGAAFTICMAIAEDAGATMFLVDAENPGYRIERMLDVTDRAFPGGHAEVSFEDCEVARRRGARHRRRGLPLRPGAARARPASPTASAGSAPPAAPRTSPSTTSPGARPSASRWGSWGWCRRSSPAR